MPLHSGALRTGRVTRREFVLGLGTLGGALALSACAPGAPTASPATPPPATRPPAQATPGAQPSAAVKPATAPTQVKSFSAEITVSNWPVLMYNTPYAVAIEKGYFKDEGIELKGIVGAAGGGTTVRNVITGGLPFGEVATPAAVNGYNAGAPLVIVGGGVRAVPEIMWVTLPGSGIKSIQDFKGKKIGFTEPGSVTEGLLNLSLSREGINPAEVQKISLGGLKEVLTALKGGAVVAAPHVDPVFSSDMKKGEKWEVVFRASQYVPHFQQMVHIVGPDLAKKSPEVVRGFLRARARGVEFTLKNLEEAATIHAKYNKLPVDVMVASLKAADPAKYYTVGLDLDAMKSVEEEMHILNLLKPQEKVNWKEMVNQDFLPAGTPKLTL